jgi:hypothetical protein
VYPSLSVNLGTCHERWIGNVEGLSIFVRHLFSIV